MFLTYSHFERLSLKCPACKSHNICNNTPDAIHLNQMTCIKLRKISNEAKKGLYDCNKEGMCVRYRPITAKCESKIRCTSLINSQ